MTRNRKLILAGTLAGLLGSVAIIGAVQADPPRGYGPGYGSYGQMMGGYGPGQHMMGNSGPGYGPSYGPGRHMDGSGPRGDHPMWRGDRGPSGAFGPGFGPGAGHSGTMMGLMFEEADADKDGKLTQAEIDAYRDARFTRYDANSDGKLSLDEFEGLLQEITKPMTVRAFQMHDPDGDAAITKEEFDRPTAGLVERLDRDDDGALSRDDRSRSRFAWGHRRHHDDNR